MKVSASELVSKTREFSSGENAFLDRLDEQDIERAAFADQDASPSTQEMLRQGQLDRRSRLLYEDSKRLGAVLEEAEAELALPIWELTDQHGRKILLKAIDIHKVTLSSAAATKIFKLEAADAPAAAVMSERQAR